MNFFLHLLTTPISQLNWNFGKSVEQMEEEHREAVKQLCSLEHLGKTSQLKITEEIQSILNEYDPDFLKL